MVGGQVWCARRRDDHRTVLKAGSPDELAANLEDAVTLVSARPADPAAGQEVARLARLYPAPWVINHHVMAGLTIFTARRPGLALSQGSAPALETELARWERAPSAD
jgi:hypothetical protein